jgi:hypothetical protein
MVTKLRNLLSARRNERGNMLIWYIFMMPVFLAAVGLAVDMSIVASTKASLQTSLDAATQGTIALSKNQTSGKPRMSSAEARASVIKLYDANRSGIYADKKTEGVPFLKCKYSGTGVVSGPQSGCNFIVTKFAYNSNGGLRNADQGGLRSQRDGYLTVTVQEKANTLFLHMLGFNNLTYTITSTARLTNTYQ